MSKKIEHMALIKDDCSLWKPLDAIHDLLEKNLPLESMVLIYEYKDESGQRKQGSVSAGLKNRYEHIGMVSTHLHDAINDSITPK